ncbi:MULTISPECIES: Asr1405/Asl0597 family protein [unclassified Anabaena]|uniref:Asr1405/Asl0597 family protein n=1 Tax=unclassified Anabaena TaxID=2619674 RepID=UPI000835C8DB|nr:MULTISPECIES: Asr1405/Asl0597 family protein [unclassified Anabaena]
MLSPDSSDGFADQVLQIPLGDRWQIYHRLQELMIPCSCPPDGSLRVQINTWLAAILVRSTVMQFLAPRHQLVDWLESCWHCNHY